MKKCKEYLSENETSSVKEPDAVYTQSNVSSETYPVWPMKKALETGMPLEESKQLIFEGINR